MLCRTIATVAVSTICLAAAPVGPDTPAPPATSETVPLTNLPNHPLSDAEFEELARTDVLAFLDASLRHYRENYRGFTATLHKQERIGGTLYKPEVIRIAVREVPYAVQMVWKEGAREVKLGPMSLGTVEGVVYAAGANKGKMIVWRPSAYLGKTMPISPNDEQARAASRYSITEAGVAQAANRTLKAWSRAKRNGKLDWRYVGTKSVEEVGGRICHVVERTCDPPEVDAFLSSETPPDASRSPEDAFHTVTVMIDAETRVQVGSRLRRADGQLVGAYFFRDIVLNPKFDADQFQPSSFKK